MNKALEQLTLRRIERTVLALEANNYDAHYIPSKELLLKKIEAYLPSGASCSVGGSVTLFDTGVIDYLKSRDDLVYHDRYAQGADTKDIFHKALLSDVYLTSTNAVTMDGMLYNMDGNSNRVAAMIYGPEKVVVIIGANKIVEDIEAARHRVKEICAPANNMRLGTPNPCVRTGKCMGCRRDTNTCVTEVVQRTQRNKGRIAVLILPESYGY